MKQAASQEEPRGSGTWETGPPTPVAAGRPHHSFPPALSTAARFSPGPVYVLDSTSSHTIYITAETSPLSPASSNRPPQQIPPEHTVLQTEEKTNLPSSHPVSLPLLAPFSAPCTAKLLKRISIPSFHVSGTYFFSEISCLDNVGAWRGEWGKQLDREFRFGITPTGGTSQCEDVCVCVREREWGVLPAMVSCLKSGTQEGEQLYLLIQAWASRRKGEKEKRLREFIGHSTETIWGYSSKQNS